MKTIRFPFEIAIAETVEKLLYIKQITFEKKELLTDRRLSGAYSDIEGKDAPSSYADVIQYLYEKNDLSDEELRNLRSTVTKKDSLFDIEETKEYFWSIPFDEYEGKGKLSLRTKSFLSNGTTKGHWHAEFILACKDLKAQRFTVEEAEELLSRITGHLTKDDLHQLEYAFRNNQFEMSYRTNNKGRNL
jgi:hypothetical protein